MSDSILLQQLAAKETTAEAIAEKVRQHPELLPEIFQGLNENKANIKFGCLKVLRLISEQQPHCSIPGLIFLSTC